MQDEGQKAAADTGLAVWFEKRDAQWRSRSRLIIFVTLLLAIFYTISSLFHFLELLTQKQFSQSIPWIAGFSSILRGLSFYGLLIALVHVMHLRMDALRPPRELVGSMSNTEYRRQIRRRFLSISLGTACWYLLGSILLDVLDSTYKIAHHMIKPRYYSSTLSIMVIYAILPICIAMLCSLVSLRLPALNTVLKSGLTLLLLILTLGISFLPMILSVMFGAGLGDADPNRLDMLIRTTPVMATGIYALLLLFIWLLVLKFPGAGIVN
jgi:hypothetical protein